MAGKITHLAKYYYPIPGGIENLTQLFCESLERDRYQVRVISFTEAGETADYRTDQVNGVEVVRIKPWTRIYSQPLSWRYIRESLRAFGDSKEVHVHWPNLIAFLAVCFACCLYALRRQPRAPFVVHWHGDAVRQRPIRFLFAPIVNFVIRRAAKMLLASEYYTEISDFRGEISKRPFFKVPLVVTDDFERTLGELGGPKLIRYDGGIFRISALGRFVWLKGFQDLVEAARELPGTVEITIMGAKDNYLPVIQEKIASLGLSGRVRILLKPGLREMIAQLRDCHLFVLPSRQEMAGIVQVEAMLCGKAVITTEIPRSAVNYFNQVGVTGLTVPVADPSALAAAIKSLMADPAKLLHLSENALRRAESEFVPAKYRVALAEYTKQLGASP